MPLKISGRTAMLTLVIGFGLAISGNILIAAESDNIAPEIRHVPSAEAAYDDAPAVVSATVTDNTEVETVTLFYRTVGDGGFDSVEMKRNSRAIDTYLGEIPRKAVKAAGVEYYIEALDTSGNKRSRGFVFEPIRLAVSSEAAPATSSASASSTGGGFEFNKKTLLYTALGALAVGAILASSSGDPETVVSCTSQSDSGQCGSIKFQIAEEP